jgi:peptidoglycan/LPS O-acetylase OafA/YrhL
MARKLQFLEELPAHPNRRFALFDSLRALAIISILGVHIGGPSGANSNAWYGVFTSHMNIGVTLFFLITGFLLYRPHALAIFNNSAPLSVGLYARHRFFRVVPAYWVALTVLAAWPGLPGVWSNEWWVYYGFLQSYRVRWIFSGIPAAWFLSVEVAFFVLLPFLAAAITWAVRGLKPIWQLRGQLAILIVLGLVSLSIRIMVHVAGADDYTNTIAACFMWLAVGMALALASVWWDGREWESPLMRLVINHPGVCWLLAGGIFGVMSVNLPRAFVPQTVLAHSMEYILYAVVAFLVMLPAVFGENAGGFPRWVLANPFLLWIGKISYSIFLWHQPLLRVIAERGGGEIIPGYPYLSLTILIVPVSLGVGWLSYQFVERPSLRLKDWRLPAKAVRP